MTATTITPSITFTLTEEQAAMLIAAVECMDELAEDDEERGTYHALHATLEEQAYTQVTKWYESDGCGEGTHRFHEDVCRDCGDRIDGALDGTF